MIEHHINHARRACQRPLPPPSLLRLVQLRLIPIQFKANQANSKEFKGKMFCAPPLVPGSPSFAAFCSNQSSSVLAVPRWMVDVPPCRPSPVPHPLPLGRGSSDTCGHPRTPIDTSNFMHTPDPMNFLRLRVFASSRYVVPFGLPLASHSVGLRRSQSDIFSLGPSSSLRVRIQSREQFRVNSVQPACKSRARTSVRLTNLLQTLYLTHTTAGLGLC